MKNNKDLIKLNKAHEKLVQGLKDSLNLGQLGWLHAGKFLYKIRKDETYKSEDSSREVTFAEFCKRPDIPLSGRKDASRLRIAQMLIRVYGFWVLQKGYSVKQLAPVGYTKLDMLVSVIEAKAKDADKWLDKATQLTSDDLIKEIKQKDKSLGEILDCSHKNIKAITFFECEDCHSTWKRDPRLKSKS